MALAPVRPPAHGSRGAVVGAQRGGGTGEFGVRRSHPTPSEARLNSTPPSPTGGRWLRRLGLGLVVSAILIGLRYAEYFPVLPNPLTFDLVLEPGEADRADPVIVTGRAGAGDFLSVAFLDPETVYFTYDHWGDPALGSLPVSFRPGTPLRLTVTMPGLDQVRRSFDPPADRLRIECDGRTLLDTSVPFFTRERSRIFFGTNPLGGTACGPILLGRITEASDRVLRGGAEAIFTWRQRSSDWLNTFPLELPVLLLLGFSVGWYGERWHRIGGWLRRITGLIARHRAFAVAAAVATFAFTWLVTYGTFRFQHGDIFGAFYDYQAAAFVRGQLDVPEDAIGGEAFETRGKIYGYFGPTPALARLPLVLAGLGFGLLSRLFMTFWFAGSLIAAYLIFQHARGLAAGARPNQIPPAGPFAAGVLVGNMGLGSTLFFLGSRSFMYHEAILAGIAFALWSVWCTLRHLEAPRSRWWIGALVCGLLSLHARPPTGLFALGCLGLTVLPGVWRTLRRRPAGWRRELVRPAGIATAALLALLSLNALAWLKFRTFDAAPLRLSRPFTDPGRLERIDGKSFHLVNLPHNFDAYLVRTNFRFERGFPWFYLGTSPDRPLRVYPNSKIDLPDHTLPLPYAMPGLFLLATLGSLAAARAHPRCRESLAVLWVGVLPMTVALLAAVAIAQRYTGDFCPFLIAAAAYGLALLESLRSSRWRKAARLVVALATLAAIAVSLAITVHYQRDTLWGMPEDLRQDYRQLRERVDRLTGAGALNG